MDGKYSLPRPCLYQFINNQINTSIFLSFSFSFKQVFSLSTSLRSILSFFISAAPAARKKAKDTDRLEEHSAESAAQGCTCPVGEITRAGIPSRCNTRLLFLFSPSLSLPALSRVPLPLRAVAPLPAFPPRTRECGKEDRREYYRDCDIRGDSSSRDLRDSQPRSRRLRATSFGCERGTAGSIRNGRRRSGGERREGGARENRARRGRASGEVTRALRVLQNRGLAASIGRISTTGSRSKSTSERKRDEEER